MKKNEAMKKSILLLLGLWICLNASHAQTKGYTVGSWTQVDAISINQNKEFKAMTYVVAPGYAFNDSFFVRLQCDLTVGMWHKNEEKTYRTNVMAGPSLGYNIVKKSNQWGIVDVVATVGNTLNNKDWSLLYYDLGVGWAIPSNEKMKWFAGIGSRYWDSHNSNFGDYFSLYAKIGFRFN
jgi:hypothetical protein